MDTSYVTQIAFILGIIHHIHAVAAVLSEATSFVYVENGCTTVCMNAIRHGEAKMPGRGV